MKPSESVQNIADGLRDNFRRNLLRTMHDKGLSQSQFCGKARLHRSQFNDLTSLTSYPGLLTICRVAVALGVDPASLLQKNL